MLRLCSVALKISMIGSVEIVVATLEEARPNLCNEERVCRPLHGYSYAVNYPVLQGLPPSANILVLLLRFL
jgi:hypothetical protein